MNKKEYDRVRCNTSEDENEIIETKILQSIKKHKDQSKDEITKRIIQLEKEWSIERWLELNASILAFIGVFLGAFHHNYWLILPFIVLPFLALHAIQGWCPPLPIMRKLNIRTRREIDWEKFCLKFMRGDFENITSSSNEDTIFKHVKKNV